MKNFTEIKFIESKIQKCIAEKRMYSAILESNKDLEEARVNSVKSALSLLRDEISSFERILKILQNGK